jgi:HEAT repeat protein
LQDLTPVLRRTARHIVLAMTQDEEWDAVRDALRAAGIDPTDLGRFVNRPHPGIPGFEPERFDSARALPVLLDWLPRVESSALRDTLASRIRQAGKSSVSAQKLIAAYRSRPSWELGDAISRTMTPTEHDAIVELAADERAGPERQMLVYALWRVKSERARALILELLADPDVSVHAIYSLRRAFGNDEAKRRLEPLRHHPDNDVRQAVTDALRRIERARSTSR